MGESFSIEDSFYNPVMKETWIIIISFNPIRIESGKITGVACFAKDISALKKSEQKQQDLNIALEKRATELISTNTELERFAYISSHDLQEPLRMIGRYLQLLELKHGDQLDEAAINYINLSVNAAARMKQLIVDLLEYSRVGSPDQDIGNTDMNDVMGQVFEILRTDIEDTGATIECKELPVLPGTSHTQMLQLMQNLIGNALKYRAAERPQIQIDYSEDNTDWTFTVKDNGIGIELEYYKKIFVVFQRLHTRDEYSGTGIGLAICKKIVQRYGGRIWVESEVGKGARFYFTLP